MIGNTENRSARRRSGWRIAVWGGASLLLLLPWIAMRFTGEVAWDPADFAIFGALLFAACGTYELTARLTGNRAYRTGVGIAVAAAVVLIWINLAVGIVGTEDDPANLMFAGVLAVGIIGALVARFQPRGMARALTATALVQASVAVVALLAGWEMETVILPMFFAALWLTSAWLFRKAAREQLPPMATNSPG
jgi:hypothetical protein